VQCVLDLHWREVRRFQHAHVTVRLLASSQVVWADLKLENFLVVAAHVGALPELKMVSNRLWCSSHRCRCTVRFRLRCVAWGPDPGPHSHLLPTRAPCVPERQDRHPRIDQARLSDPFVVFSHSPFLCAVCFRRLCLLCASCTTSAMHLTCDSRADCACSVVPWHRSASLLLPGRCHRTQGTLPSEPVSNMI
jgi:hypothetical protein